MQDNICNRLAQEVPGGAEAGWPESRGLFVPMLTEVLISGNTIRIFPSYPWRLCDMSIQDRTILI
jgi:hypothetical protein